MEPLDIAIWISMGVAISGVLSLFVLLFLMGRNDRRVMNLVIVLVNRMSKRLDYLEELHGQTTRTSRRPDEKDPVSRGDTRWDPVLQLAWESRADAPQGSGHWDSMEAPEDSLRAEEAA